MKKVITRKEIDDLYRKVGIDEQPKIVSNTLNIGTMKNILSTNFNSATGKNVHSR